MSDARDRLIVDGYDANYGVVEAAPNDMWAIFSPGMQDELRIGRSADVAEALGVDRPDELQDCPAGSWVRYRNGVALKLGALVGEGRARAAEPDRYRDAYERGRDDGLLEAVLLVEDEMHKAHGKGSDVGMSAYLAALLRAKLANRGTGHSFPQNRESSPTEADAKKPPE